MKYKNKYVGCRLGWHKWKYYTIGSDRFRECKVCGMLECWINNYYGRGRGEWTIAPHDKRVKFYNQVGE